VRTNIFLRYPNEANEASTLVHRAKSTKDLMKEFNKAELKPMSTLMSTVTSLGPNKDGDAVDQMEYMSMIGSLMYLIVTQSDIQFAVGLCAHFEASPHSSHQKAVQ
jgi:hypothetical protein